MDHIKKLEEMIEKSHGTILSSDLDRYSIPRTYLQMMVTDGKLEKVDRGVYVSTDAVQDEMFALQKKYDKIIYSHETALFIHGLSDRTPFEYAITVPSGYKAGDSITSRCKVYYIKKELHDLGELMSESTFGNAIKVYNLERTICDIIRSRSRIDVQIFNEALKRFASLNSKDLFVLMDYAEKLKIASVVSKYLEVLL